jgi:hypothetical protein
MAFGTQTDHFSLATTDLILIDSSLTPVAQSNADALDINGDIAAAAYFGNSSGTYKDATCVYLLKSGTLNLNTLKLGELSTGVIASSISIATDNSESEFPKVTVSGQLGAAAVTAPTGSSNTWTLPSITIAATSFAQPMGFTVTGGELQSCTLEASCNYGVATDGEGEPAAFGLSGAAATTSGEFVSATDAPAWTPALGWEETQAPTSIAPQAAWQTSSAAARLILSRDAAL